MMKIKYIVIFVIILSSLSSCKIFEGSGKTEDAEEVIVDCYAANYKTTDDYFRATSTSYDSDEIGAQDKALLNAKQVVVSTISSVVRATASKYIDQSPAGKKQNFKAQYAPKVYSKIKEVLQAELTDYSVICQNTTKEENGQYKADISLEVNKRTVIDGVNNKMYSSAFKDLYDGVLFEQIFNDELKKLINTQATQDNTIPK